MKNTIWTGLLLMFCSVSAWAQCRATPASSSSTPTFAASGPATSTTFSVANRGAAIFDTQGGSGSPMVGYARVQTSSGSTPSAYLTFQNRLNGILVGQASVGATTPTTSGRIYTEVGGGVDTGVAIANPNSSPVTVTFYFTDAAGANSPAGTFPIGANSQMSAFVTQAPFNGGASLSGTMTFTSSLPIAVIALRGLLNERGEFLMTTLPVTSLSASPSTTQYMPHFADGDGWKTQVVLINSTDAATTGTVQFYSTGSASIAGAPLALNVNGQVAVAFPYTIPARSSVKLATSGLGSVLTSGSVRVTTASGTPATGLAIFTYRNQGVTVSEAGVPAVSPSTAFRMYEYDCGDYVGQIQTGIAVTNPGASAATVTIELTELWGEISAGMTASIVVPPNGQVASFLRQLLPAMAHPFHGVARISSSSPIAVTALRGDYNARNDFLITTALPTSENAPASSAGVIFPHLVDLGGYTTEFVLYSGVAGPTATGNVSFFSQNGTPLMLNLN